MKTIQHWVAGKPTNGTSDRTAPVFDPATGEQQAVALLASVADCESAIAAARDAFLMWSQSSLSARTKVLFAFREIVNRRADELTEAITAEHGKVLSDARGEVQRGVEVVEFACGIPHLLKGDYSDEAGAWWETGVPAHLAGRAEYEKHKIEQVRWTTPLRADSPRPEH